MASVTTEWRGMATLVNLHLPLLFLEESTHFLLDFLGVDAVAFEAELHLIVFGHVLKELTIENRVLKVVPKSSAFHLRRKKRLVSSEIPFDGLFLLLFVLYR